MDTRHLGRAGLVSVTLLLSAGCAAVVLSPQLAPAAPRLCLDQRPPKLFLNEQCKDGVCGYTCEPGRWPPPPPIIREPSVPQEPVLRQEPPITSTPLKPIR